MTQPTVVHPGRRSSATTAANSERRAEILAIAAEIFARKGFQNTTVREIADASGILSGSLYHHFESKEAILDELLSTMVTDLCADYRTVVEAGEDPVTTLRNLVHQQFRALVQHRAAITTATNDANLLRELPRFGHLDEANREIADLWEGVIRQGIEQGVFRRDLDPHLQWAFIRGAMWGTVQMRSQATASPDDLAEAYLSTLLGGIGA
jgi:TetR/AcrR family transcriptional regulator, cholesterol catabolism regulator